MPNLIEITVGVKNEAGKVLTEVKAQGEDLSKGLAKAGAVSGLALAGIAYESVKMATQFQSSTTRLVTSAGETDANIGMVRKGMLDMASQVGFSAIELSKGMYTVESAGFHGAAGLTVLKAAAQGAKDENADLSKVANAVTDVLVDYHMKASDAATVTSQMVTAVGFGKTTFDDFSGSMHNILPLASAMHLSFADVSGVLAEMTAHGMSADQASQNMANAMRSLIVPTSKQSNEFKLLGTSAQEVRDKLGTVGLSGTMEFLAQTAKKVGPNVLDQEAALKKLMGTAPGLSVALMTTGENFTSTTAAIKGIAAATQDANGNVKGFAEMQQTLGQKVAELKAGFDTLMITMGNKLIPVISAVVDWMNKHHDVVVAVLTAVGLLAAGVAAYTIVVKLAAIATGLWEAAQKAYTIATAAAAGATEAMSVAMTAMPLVAITAGVLLLAKKLDDLTASTPKAAANVDQFTAALMNSNNGLNTTAVGAESATQYLNVLGTKLPGVTDPMVRLGVGLAGVSEAFHKGSDELTHYDGGLAAMVNSGHAGEAKKLVDQIAAATDEHGVKLTNTTKDFPAYFAALDAQKAKAALAVTATDALTTSQDSATTAQDSLTNSVAAATTAYDDAKKSAKGYVDSIDALFGKFGSASDAQAKLTLAMAAATKQVTAGRDAVNLNTEAGAKNFQTLQGLATANLSVAENMLKTNHNADEATKSLRDGATAIDNLASRSGFTKDQISKLNIELYGVPAVKDITISADVTSAIDNIGALKAAVDSAASSMATMPIRGSRMRQARAAGGEIGAAATGGDRGGLVLVGEQGPELVRLPTGSTVRSNPDTMADLAGARVGGGGGTVQLVWVGPEGDELFTLFKRWIRARFGNDPNSVQKALGQAF